MSAVSTQLPLFETETPDSLTTSIVKLLGSTRGKSGRAPHLNYAKLYI
jgi:hypothetical protein